MIHRLFENQYDDPALDSAVIEFMVSSRQLFDRTSGFPTPEVYLNYAHGDEGPEVWYSLEKLPQLSDLKSTWDPQQLFSFNYPVPVLVSDKC
jgi:fumiquinazoline A oxidase